MENKIIKHPSLNEIAYDFIKEKIITGEFEPGFRLKEETLVKMLGISKTPIKLGIAKLHQEGLVNIVPRRGSYVISLTVADVREIFQLREVLEGLSARLSIQQLTDADIVTLKNIHSEIEKFTETTEIHHYIQMDNQFHATIIYASGHHLLLESLKPILTKIEIIKYRTIIHTLRRLETLEEHAAIIRALENRNESQAEEAMRIHLQNTMDIAIRNLSRIRGKNILYQPD